MASTATTEKTADRQRALAEALAKIDAAFPPRRSLEKLCKALVRSPNFRFIEMGDGE